MYDLFSTLETLSRDSDFSATLSERGGYITFSNSGRRGGTKYFQIGLDSLLQTLRDILANLSAFSGMSDYVESDWRNNGSEYFNDPVANANSTVQTKPLFSTLSKLIIWGNQPAFDDIDSDQRIILQEDALRNTIVKLERIADSFKPAVSLESSSLISPVSNIQTIYYGCPGTGKSHTVKKIAEGENGEKIIKYDDGTNNIFRTTFHPDYDYATFVGCYKPVKEGAAIDYKFIPQVFTNAYVCAYRHREDPISSSKKSTEETAPRSSETSSSYWTAQMANQTMPSSLTQNLQNTSQAKEYRQKSSSSLTTSTSTPQ